MLHIVENKHETLIALHLGEGLAKKLLLDSNN